MIGHASVLIEHDQTRLLTDPWYFGTIFNDSWELLSEPRYDLLGKITHIWISHEHPDHLHFPTLKMLRDSFLGHCTILIQNDCSHHVLTALRTLGFDAVRALPLGTWIKIGKDFEILCLPSRRIDSMLAVRTSSASIVNLNDCKMGSNFTKQVANIVGRPDVLLSQFSIASWPGNKGDVPLASKRYRAANRSRAYADVIQPKQLLLFASFARFCHQENEYINDWALPPAEAEEFLKECCDCSVNLLYPGDRWSSEAGITCTGSPSENYTRDWIASKHKAVRPSESIAMAKVVEAGHMLNASLGKCVPTIVRKCFRPVLFFVEDHQQAICLDIAKSEITVAHRKREECHIGVHSQALWYAFAHRWGFDTLDTSGRFQLLNGPKRPGAIRLCDQYAAGFNFRDISAIINSFAPSQWWLKRGEMLDAIERRIRGRPTI
jgi:hypothetical protein